MASKKNMEPPGYKPAGGTDTPGYRKLYKCEDYLKKLLKENLPDGSRIFLFGSRASGNYSRGSDIDIGIIARKLDDNAIIKIKEIIDDSFVPFKVDIIDFTKVDEKFKKAVLRSSIRWNQS